MSPLLSDQRLRSFCLLCLVTGLGMAIDSSRGPETLDRIAESTQASDTDYTGQIHQFSEIGLGGDFPIRPRPWVCYTSDVTDVIWERPDGVVIPSDTNRQATGSELFMRVITFGVALHRGPDYNSPDGEYCCVRTTTNERRCVTLTPCPTLTRPNGGIISYNPATNVATYSCHFGYTLIGSTQRTCQSSSQWSGEEPSCTPDCRPPMAPQNGQVTLQTGETTFGSVAVYSCDTCYEIGGISTHVCGEGGLWVPSEQPICTVIDCGSPPDIAHGLVHSPNTECNSVATYSCEDGYEVVGISTLTCQANGQWTSPKSKCKAVDCGPLQAPANGQVDTPQGTLFKNVANYSCASGYNLTGCVTRECLSNGSWSCEAPFCADNVMIQFKFGPTSHCVTWSDWKVDLMFTKMQSLVLKATQSRGHVIPKENIQRGYFSCYRSTTETTYRTTITGTERVSAVGYTRLIQEWVESGVTTRMRWYVLKIDKSCPVTILSMDDEECV